MNRALVITSSEAALNLLHSWNSMSNNNSNIEDLGPCKIVELSDGYIRAWKYAGGGADVIVREVE